MWGEGSRVQGAGCRVYGVGCTSPSSSSSSSSSEMYSVGSSNSEWGLALGESRVTFLGAQGLGFGALSFGLGLARD